MNTSLLGPALELRVGQEYDRPEPEAIRLIERGLATPVRESGGPEKAIKDAPEKAAARSKRG